MIPATKDPTINLGPGQNTYFNIEYESDDTLNSDAHYIKITATSSDSANEDISSSKQVKKKIEETTSSNKQMKELKIKKAKQNVSFRETRSEYTTDVFLNDDGQITITIRDPRTPDHIVTSKVLNIETGERFEYDDYKGIKVAEYYGTNLATDMNLTIERAIEYKDKQSRTLSKAMQQLKKYKTADNTDEYQFLNQPYYFIVYGKLIMILLNTDVIDVTVDDFKVFRDLDEFCYEALWSLKTAFECTQCQIVFTTDMNSEIANLKATYEQDLNVQLNILQALITKDEYAQIQEVLKTYELEDDFILHEKLIEARKKKWAEKERVQEVLNTIENLMLKYRMALNNEKYQGGYASSTVISSISFNLTQPFYTSPKNETVR